MEPQDPAVLATHSHLLDSREAVQYAIPGTWKSQLHEQEPVPIGLMVTDHRIVVGLEDADPKKKSRSTQRDRRLRIDAAPADGRLRSNGLPNMYFDASYAPTLQLIDEAAGEWDRVSDEQLGILSADDQGDYLLATAVEGLPDFRVRFDGGLPSEVLVWANEVTADPTRYREMAYAAAVQHMLPLKNESWLRDDEEPLTEETFRNRLIMSSVAVSIDGFIEFFFNDGTMFGHHSVVATSFDAGTTWSAALFG